MSVLQTHSSPCSYQLPARHPKIIQGKQRDQLSGVLGQPFVAYLGKAKLALNDSERMLHLGPHPGLELLDLVQQGTQPGLFIVCPSFA